MYAGGAFVLIELANNVTVPLNLPDWTPKLVILIALVAFPIVVVLSWIFDITPTGFDKTEPNEDAKKQEQTSHTGKRRLKVSDVIILVLIVMVGILVYPKIFGSENLNAMTVPVTIMNEYGEKETRRVFKENYLTRLVLFPFSSETNDSSVNWMGWGILEAVLEDQSQFSNMLIDWDDATNLNEQIDFAKERKYPYFLTGVYHVDGPVFKITARIIQTSNGAVRNEHVYTGTDFFNLMDSISVRVRRDLGIPEIILYSTPDLPIRDLLTDNLDAYGNYIQGKYWWQFYTVPASTLKKAIQMDSTFAKACYEYAYLCYNYQFSDESAKRSINQAIRHRIRLSEFSDINARVLYYLTMGETAKVVDLSENQYELRPRDLRILNRLFDTYLRLNLLDRAEEVAIRRNKLVPNHPPFQLQLAQCYLLSGKPKKSLEVLNALLDENPENVEALLKIGEAHLHVKDLYAAEDAFKRAIYLMPEQENYWAKFLDHTTYVRNHAITDEFLESYGITWRNEIGAFSGELSIIQNHLRVKSDNQMGFFLYPISDTDFVYAFKNGDTFSFLEYEWFFNNNGKAIRVRGEQWEDNFYYLMPFWIEDHFILDAKDLLANGRTKEAMAAFQEAYTQNPEHYYLANYIQHLEFVLNPDYDSIKSLLDSYIGRYSDLSIHSEDDRFYYTDYESLTFELLPLSQDRFMVPSKYELQVQMFKDQEVVNGLKFLHRDGREEYIQLTTTESWTN